MNFKCNKYKFKNMKIILAIICFTFISQVNPLYAKETKYSKIKNDSYKAIAEAFYNQKTYDKFRIEIIEMLGKLSDKTEKSYSDESTENSKIYKTLRSMLASVTSNMNKQRGKVALNTQEEVDSKASEVASKGDVAIAYMLKDALSDPDYTVQLYAGTSINHIKDKSALPLFLTMLQNTDDKDKSIALGIIGNINDNEATPAIIKLLDTPNISRRMQLSALNALEKFDSKDVEKIFVSLLGDKDKGIKALAIAYLSARNNPEGVKKLKEMLANKDDQLLIATRMPSIVSKAQDIAIPWINELISTDDYKVKMYTINSIEKLQNTDQRIALLQKMLETNDLEVKYHVFKALSKINSPKIVPLLQSIDFGKPDIDVKVADVLIKSDNPGVYPVLETYLKKDNTELKLNIARYFLKVNKNKELAKSILLELLKTNNDLIKYSAAVILLENDYDEGRDIVRSMLTSTNPSVKAKAVITLASHKDKSVVPFLQQSIKDIPDYSRTYGAALLLYNLGEKSYIDVLTKYLSLADIEPISEQYINKDLFKELLNNNNSWVKINVATSLYESGDKTALSVIRGLLNDSDVKVRSKAAKLIGEFGSPEDIDTLHKLTADKSVRVRVNASEAILRILNRQESKLGAKNE